MITKTLDWNEYLATARALVSEGCVLLENHNDVLPFKKNTKVAIFGRIQNNYYKSGTGSGGLVNVTKITDIVEGLKESGHVVIDEELQSVYADWEKLNPYEEGIGWGQELWSQKEMPLTLDIAEKFASKNDVALVIIGRTAGEDKDNKNEPGSYKLTELEKEMLFSVRKSFSKMVVLLNVANIIDMSFVRDYTPDAVLYAWQGGMTGGSGTADVLTGKVSPSGKLTDTIAYEIDDYPAVKNFGDPNVSVYEEDIFVGYRYFETFAKDKVFYPFGFGLSYTSFDVKNERFCECIKCDTAFSVKAKVLNTGKCSGKEVLQMYVSFPQGKLGNASRILCGFAKTKLLESGESEEITLGANLKDFASFDDLGVTGYKSCRVLEEGTYEIFLGTDVRNAFSVGKLNLSKTIVTEELNQAMSPVQSFNRFKASENEAGIISLGEEKIEASKPMQTAHRNAELENVKKEFANKGLTFDGKEINISDEDLSYIVRGEGMGSPKVTPGTASAFGGVTEKLKSLGIPCACCDDGPSGMRLDSGAQAFSLPIGTMIASSFNLELTEKLYEFLALEMVSNKVDILLAPGINIHRFPLNGRNFEYFSEDPFLTGKFAAAEIRSLHSVGVTGSLKHFCGNNQEFGRRSINSVISERALRDIYLKGFEIAVKEANADCIMTTYGAVNGIWTAGNYDLCTTILRREWGFKGIVMTDWWALISDENTAPSIMNYGAMIRSQNDLFMVCQSAEDKNNGDDTIESLRNGSLDRAELLRAAQNILSFIEKSHSYKRLMNNDFEVKIINRPVSDDEVNADNIIYYKLGKDEKALVPLENVKVKKGTSFTFALDIQNPAEYKMTITAKSDANAVAQMPVSISTNGVLRASFTWNGTGGEWKAIESDIMLHSKYNIVKMYFAQSGLDLRDIEFVYKGELTDKMFE